jgi:hypothetical protein
MLTWSERKMPTAAGNLPQTDLMLAPSLSKYYFEQHAGNIPTSIVLSKIKTNNPLVVDISGKKEWSFKK